eukprot:TRINITY_DN23050_c0_g3_i3.p1 TRINITY_DN23050_c0_g3~~TRINITY_DN23050_c0_g3_i3.p1  ORF type:complete len:242 (-),score=40.19 TRINITY_DN23050_c0_g3_i3:465-1190(-)
MAPKSKPPAKAKAAPKEKALPAKQLAPEVSKRPPVVVSKSPAKAAVQASAGDAEKSDEVVEPPQSPNATAGRVKVTSPGSKGDTAMSTALALSPARGGYLSIAYTTPGDGAAPVLEGLVKMRRAGTFCDATVVAAGGAKISVHRAVLAAGSATLAERVKLAQSAQSAELNLGSVSHEAADILVRWLYGEVSAAVFRPSTSQVNEEVLKLSSELGLPLLRACSLFSRAATLCTHHADRFHDK